VNIAWRQHRSARQVVPAADRLLRLQVATWERGNVFPWWEYNEESTELLLEYGIEYGIEYGHSTSHRNYQAYHLRKAIARPTSTTPKKAEAWMKPLAKAQETGPSRFQGEGISVVRCRISFDRYNTDRCRSPADDVHQE